MHVALFGRTVSFRWRTLVLAIVLTGFLTLVGLFAFYFIRSFVAIRQGGTDYVWSEERLDSSVGRALANTQVTAEDLKNLTREGRPSLGPAQAPVTVVAFLDYGCPYCRRAAGPFRETMLKYQGRVRFVIRDFPVEELHPNAFQAALAARCTFAQGKGWAFHDLLLAQQGDLVPADFAKYANQAGADMVQYQTCIDTRQFAADIEQDLSDGLRAGVEGTPTYFFNGIRIQGVPQDGASEYFTYLVERFLKEPAAPSTTP